MAKLNIPVLLGPLLAKSSVLQDRRFAVDSHLDMHTLLLYTFVAFLGMASSTHQALPTSVPGPVDARDIWMARDGGEVVKFRMVPITYSNQDIKHADLLGMMMTFDNGETWMTLDRKRLFLMPDDARSDDEVSTDSIKDWPIMSPEELKVALAASPPYEQVYAEWKDAEARWKATRNTKRDESSCLAAHCDRSRDCWPHSTVAGGCLRCLHERCTWHQYVPNDLNIHGAVDMHAGRLKELQ